MVNHNIILILSAVLRLGKSKKYSDTLCLPRTLFPARLEGNKRAQRDQANPQLETKFTQCILFDQKSGSILLCVQEIVTILCSN